MTSPIRILPRLDAEALIPNANEVCVSITNPNQALAHLEGWGDVLRVGFHDTEKAWGNYEPISAAQARDILGFCHWHRSFPMTIHCEFGASRSVAVGVFVAAWLKRPLLLPEPVLNPNRAVIRMLRAQALKQAFLWQDWRLLELAASGPARFLHDIVPPEVAATYPQ